MLDIITQEGWKYGEEVWKRKLCPKCLPPTTEEPTTTIVPAWKTQEPTTVPTVCEPSLIQEAICNFLTYK